MLASVQLEDTILEALWSSKEITSEQLALARRESEFTGEPIVEVLLANNVISDEQVAKVYASAAELRSVNLGQRSVTDAWALTLPENIALRKQCISFGEVSDQLVVAVADPFDPTLLPTLEGRFNRPLQLIVCPRFQIEEQQRRVYGQARERGVRTADFLPTSTPVAEVARPKPRPVSETGINVVEELDSIIDEAVDRRASDVHIETDEDRVRIRVRVDGRLAESRVYPMDVLTALISRVKVLAKLDITERRLPQDGRFTHRSFGQDIDVRVASIPTVEGERCTLRLLGLDRTHLDLNRLGMEPETRQCFERLIKRPYGLILITGPTGSGKSTTMYTALQMINTIDKHIITAEDPVEFQIKGVNQIQVDAEHGVTFASCLRSIVRHDPDVIMVGEIRDPETAHLALEASLTGHLVFATLHTNNAVGAATRLLEMECEPYLVASAIIGLFAQRLVRRVCPNCAEPFAPTSHERKLLGVPMDRTGVEVFRGKGCPRCLRSGYYGRVGIFEHVVFDQTLAELVLEKAPSDRLQRQAIERGARTLRDDAVTKVLHGQTTIEEALRVAADDYGVGW